jgi:O-succinylbenzoic acid--CoA ligase
VYELAGAIGRQIRHGLDPRRAGTDAGIPRVAHCFDLVPEAVPALLAIRVGGCAAFPIHPHWEPDRRRLLLNEAGIEALIAPAGMNPPGPEWDLGQVEIEGSSPLELFTRDMRLELFTRDMRPNQIPPAPPGTEILLATSGTSGRLRLACHSWKTLRANAAAANERNVFGPGDSWHATLAWAHVGGLAVAVRAEVAGGCVSIGAPRFDAGALRRPLTRDSATHLSLVPTMLHQALEEGVPPDGLRCVLVGGAAATDALLDRARGAGWPVVPTYGLTEAGSQVATAFPEPAPPAARAPRGEDALPLLDGFQARTAVDGELAIRGSALMLGYLSRPTPFDREGWFPTGDLGVVVGASDPRRVRIVGRRSERLISGGANVDPIEVEMALREHPAVRGVCVTGTPDAVWGEIVTAIVATDSGASIDGLEGWARQRLSGPRVPRRWWFVDTLPSLPSGKIDRAGLRELASRRAYRDGGPD